jgi:DNA-binding CsgD family transcriptional regulator
MLRFLLCAPIITRGIKVGRTIASVDPAGDGAGRATAREELAVLDDPANDGGLRQRWALTAILAAVAVGGGADLWLDRPQGPGWVHVVFEGALLVASLGAMAWLWAGWTRTRRSLAGARADSEAHRSERDAWRARAEKLLRGLGDEIDAQLRRWNLTPAERETALFLLKGYGHKEIAALSGRSERTVRQHAVAVYRKSGLAGRAELSAFFLEDLLLPNEVERPAGDSKPKD